MSCSWDIDTKYKDLDIPKGFKLPDSIIDLEETIPPEVVAIGIHRIPSKKWWQFWKE